MFKLSILGISYYSRFDKTFCHDFQNSTCRRPNCKFLHYTKEEEEMFRRTGYLPNDIQWSYRPASSTFDEKTPICKVIKYK